jgi:hypothetical protein
MGLKSPLLPPHQQQLDLGTSTKSLNQTLHTQSINPETIRWLFQGLISSSAHAMEQFCAASIIRPKA